MPTGGIIHEILEKYPTAQSPDEQTEFGLVESSIRHVSPATSEEGDRMVIDMRIECSCELFPPDRYPDLCTFVDKLSNCLNGKIVLKAKR